MIHDLQDLGSLYPVNCLRKLIVIDQDQLLLAQVQQCPPRYHADITILLIEHRKIMVPFLLHDRPDALRLICDLKRRELLASHEIPDRHTLVDQPCDSRRIVRRAEQDTVVFLRKYLYRLGDLCPHRNHDTGRPHLDRAQLCLITVSQQYHVARMYVILKHIRICRRDDHLTALKITVCISHNDLRIDCFQYILI